MSSPCKLISSSFPPELVLEAIQRLPFGNGQSLATLSKVHPRIRQLLRTYERSITKHVIRKELPHVLSDFPCDERTFGYAWLAQSVRRYDIVDDIMAVLVSEMNCYVVKRHNMALVNAGLLLLYRLVSIEDYVNKLAFIKSLSRDPLTAVYLAINHATLTARYHGEGVIHQRTYGRFMDANTLSLRNDIEFCFAEGALNLGPSFISDVLLHAGSAECALLNLYHDHALSDWDIANSVPGDFMPPVTQGPEKDPSKRQRSLFTTLLERLAELAQCPLEEIRNRIEAETDLPDHSLAWIGLAEKARLVQGQDLEYVDEA